MTKTAKKPTKKVQKKTNRGRPTKYNHTIQLRADKYLNECIQSGTTPFYEELSTVVLNVNDETLTEWAKKHEEFSATLERLDMYQKLRLQKDGLENKNNANMAQFVLKVKHNMRDVTTLATDPDNPFPASVVMYLPNNERSEAKK